MSPATRGFRIATAFVGVQVDDAGLRESIVASLDAAVAGLQAHVGLGLDDGAAASLDEEVSALVGALDFESIHLRMQADSTGLREEAEAEAKAAGGETITMHVRTDHDAGSLAQDISAVAAAVGPAAGAAGADVGKHLSDGLWQETQTRTRAAAGQFSADTEKLTAGLNKTAEAADRTGGKLAGAGQKAAGAGSQMSGLGSIMSGIGGALVAGLGAAAGEITLTNVAIVALLPALAAIPAAAVGAAGGIATLAGAFGGIITAVKDSNAAIDAGGQSAAQAAVTAFSNAVAQRNALQQITDARRQAAIAAQNSADAVVSARQRETEATYSAQQAEQALVQARVDAENQMVDSQNAAADAQLAAQRAASDLVDAQNALNLAQANGMTTPKQLADAKLKLAEAEQGVKDANQRSKEATESANMAQQNGVDQAPSVVSAQHAVTQALQAQADAAHGVQTALRDQTDQQISSTEAVKNATQALADMRRQQELAAAAAASGGAASKVAQDMAKLTPIAREAVLEIEAMRGQFNDLKAAAQNAVIPGFLTFLHGIGDMGPQLKTAIGEIGKVFGQTFAQFGQLFSNPQFQKAFGDLVSQAAGAMRTIMSALAPFMGSITQIGVAAAPILNALASGIAEIVKTGLPEFLAGLVSNASGAGQGIKAIADIISGLAGPIGTLIGQVAGILGPILKALAPVIVELVSTLANALLPVLQILLPPLGDVAVALGQALMPVIQAIAPILVDLAKNFAGMMPQIVPLIKFVSQLAVILLQALEPILRTLLPIFGQFLDALLPILEQALIPMIPQLQSMIDQFLSLLPVMVPMIQDILQMALALAPLIPLFIQISTTIDTILVPIVLQLMKWFQELYNQILGPVTDAFVKIAGVFTRVFTDVNNKLQEAETWVSTHIDSIVKTVTGLPGRLEAAGKGAWDWLGKELKDVINGGFVDSMNWVLHQINWLTQKLSDTWSWAGIPSIGPIDDIPHLAKGGTAVAPGVVEVGEEGPELMFMAPGASVVPLPKQTIGAAQPRSAAAAAAGPVAHFHYYGTQQPTPEQKAQMRRDFGVMVSA